MKLHVVVAVALAAALGCGIEEDGVSARTASVVGGGLATGDPAVGFVIGETPDGEWSETGVLISPRHVLTAVLWGAEVSSWRFRLVGEDGSTALSELDVVSAVTDPEFDDENPFDGHSLVVLELASAIPESTAMPVPLASAPPTVDDEVRLVGFGATGPDAYDNGIRRAVTTTIVEVPEGGAVFMYGDATHGGCTGDSGGPLLRAGASGEEVVGLSVWGAPGCNGRSGATRIDASRTFIDERIAAAEPDAGPVAPDAGPVESDAGGGGGDGDGDGNGVDDGTGGGCSTTSSNTASAWLTALLCLVFVSRRRRARR